jgi:hypothetical protein
LKKVVEEKEAAFKAENTPFTFQSMDEIEKDLQK